MNTYRLLLLLLLLSLPLSSWAQTGRMMGTVVDDQGEPLPGATVRVLSAKRGGKTLQTTATTAHGLFAVEVTGSGQYIEVTYIGFERALSPARAAKGVTVRLVPTENTLQDAVVTGYYSKAKNSFTGTAVQVTGEQLRDVNSNNFFEGLKVFDPSFQVVDTRGMFGSDPNHIPDNIAIRGQNSMPDISEASLKTVTSLPIFILDGFEVAVQRVYDLDMNRIASVTILKDAAASAIYGSRAANGVVVIETRLPEAGRLQVSYTLAGGIEMPDLTSYNLMNAAEALEFQRVAGVFDAYSPGEDAGNNLNSYNAVLRAVRAGQDTYWLSKPLRTGLRHKHSLMIDGSVGRKSAAREGVRYSVNIGVGDQRGVMRGSKRTSYEAGAKLIYSTGRLHVSNDLQFSMTDSHESPYGNFSTYTAALPYYTDRDSQGEYYPTLSIANMAPPGLRLGVLASQRSPVYEARYLNSYSAAESMNVTDNVSLNWLLAEGLRLKGNFSVGYDYGRTDAYISPESFAYTKPGSDTAADPGVLLRRGRYDLGHTSAVTTTGNLVTSYTREMGRVEMQGILGAEARQTRSEADGYAMTGFLSDAEKYISYAAQYEPYGRPSGSESTVRTAGVFSNINLAYASRYLCDLTGRIDGSSLYGRHHRSAPYWSAGLRWNIHHEPWMRHARAWVDNLALRASLGTTGNQNYSRSQAENLYRYLTQVYGGYFGALISVLGNPDLKGQETLNRNIGLEGTLCGRRISFDVNFYYNTTHGNLTDITIAPSIGFASYKANMGDLVNRGMDFSITYTPLHTRDMLLSLSANGAWNRNRIRRISDTLRRYNDTVNQQANQSTGGTPGTVFLFREGESMNTIYAVRSLGIDPGTGRELYLDREGNTTYEWRAEDQVPVGCGEPTLEGYFGGNVKIHGWELSTRMGYSFGADRYNYTLHQKIENVSYMTNNDRRALTERWQQPGDHARYKAIRDNSPTHATSRFVQRENRLAMTSLRLAYTLPQRAMAHTPLSMLRFSVTANDLFYVSTIRQERGLAYPYARAITFSAQVNF